MGMRLHVIVLVGALLGASAPAVAQTSDDAATAEVAWVEGQRLMEAGKYAEACAQFEASQHYDPAPGTLLSLAHCEDLRGRTATAWALFKETLELVDPKNDPEQRANEAREQIALLEPRLVHLTIIVGPDTKLDGLQIRRDGVVVSQALYGRPMPVDPGEHVIEASAIGRVTWTTRSTLSKEGTTVEVTVPPLDVDVTGGAAGVTLALQVTCGQGADLIVRA